MPNEIPQVTAQPGLHNQAPGDVAAVRSIAPELGIVTAGNQTPGEVAAVQVKQLPSRPFRDDGAEWVERQNQIAAADRANREAAGLPQRPIDI